MRISDWSSDVCSSDLQVVDGRIVDAGEIVAADGGGAGRRPEITLLDPGGQRLAEAPADDVEIEAAHAVFEGGHVDHAEDRKSVGSGKGGVVRVDLGGSRIITKTTNKVATSISS